MIFGMATEDAAVLGIGSKDVISDSFMYVCGRLLSQKQVVLPSLSTAMSTIWGWTKKLLIQEEEGEILVFLFKEQKMKDHVINGGP
ncbi:hypothetical protein ACLB2K_035674 [Fragaria x ananassa]